MKEKALMNPLSIKDIEQYVEENIQNFHDKRLEGLEIGNFTKLLKRKNPYLFKVKNMDVAADVVKGILDAYISSSEETKFGDWLEGLAIYINKQVYGGTKSAANGIDLEFEKDGVHYLVNIKSGPNWGNASQIRKMKQDFDNARRTLRTSGSQLRIEAVNGCCYGKSKHSLMEGNFYKYCGQKFWEFISGDKDLYLNIIKPLGSKVQERNDIYILKYTALLNKLTFQFSKEFCDDQGLIDWPRIIKLNSSYEPAVVSPL